MCQCFRYSFCSTCLIPRLKFSCFSSSYIRVVLLKKKKKKVFRAVLRHGKMEVKVQSSHVPTHLTQAQPPAHHFLPEWCSWYS